MHDLFGILIFLCFGWSFLNGILIAVALQGFSRTETSVYFNLLMAIFAINILVVPLAITALTGFYWHINIARVL